MEGPTKRQWQLSRWEVLEVETEAKPGHVLQVEIRRLADGWDVGVSGERDQGCWQGSGLTQLQGRAWGPRGD